MPTFYGQVGQMGVPSVAKSMPIVRSFQSGDNAFFERPYSITGTTKNSAGVALAACNVKLFRTADDSLVSQTTSDAAGYYIVPASALLTHYVVSYKAGSPDVTGATVNTLVGT